MGNERRGMQGSSHMPKLCWSGHWCEPALYLISLFLPFIEFFSYFLHKGCENVQMHTHVWETPANLNQGSEWAGHEVWEPAIEQLAGYRHGTRGTWSLGQLREAHMSMYMRCQQTSSQTSQPIGVEIWGSDMARTMDRGVSYQMGRSGV